MDALVHAHLHMHVCILKFSCMCCQTVSQLYETGPLRKLAVLYKLAQDWF